MNIAIVGTGGVGGYFGGLMAKGGLNVTFVARGAHYDKITENGLCLSTVDGDYKLFPINVVDSVSKLSGPELVFVCTKTYDRDLVAQELERVVNDTTIIIPLQNGIDNDLVMAKHCRRGRIYAGLVYLISARTEAGRIVQSPGPRKMIFGERMVAQNPDLLAIQSLLRSAGIDATASEDIERDVWTKFIWLTAFAGMTSLCRAPIGPIVSDPQASALLFQCLDEAVAVAASQGIVLSDQERQALRERSEKYKTEGPLSKSSMLVDIENLRATEIETLNGTLVRLGRENDIATPLHQTIYTAIRVASRQNTVRVADTGI